MELNQAIIGRFQEHCARRKKTCFVLIIPGSDAIRGVSVGNVLADVSRNFGRVSVVWEATEHYRRISHEGDSICQYIGVNKDCVGHFNIAGYASLADFVYQRLQEVALAPGQE
jgi:hypothetical protein